MRQNVKVVLQGFLKRTRVGRKVYPWLQRKWRSIVIPLRRRRLHRHGYTSLEKLHGLFARHNIVYYIEAGTMLGFIRDHGFIKHDDDIDICVPPGGMSLLKVLKILLKDGYEFVQCIEYEGAVLEFTVRDQFGIPIDVFTCRYDDNDPSVMLEAFPRWYPNRAYPNDRANTLLEFVYVKPKGIKSIQVHGVHVCVPENAEEVLDSEFGPWRVPDPMFKSEMLKHRELPGFCYRIDLSQALME